jgi:hypothetical protein
MPGINRLLENIDLVNIPQAIEDGFVEIAHDLTKQQRDQLLHGELSDGHKTGLYKNPKYAAKKFAMNPLAGEGHKDYLLTGAFQGELFVDVRQTSIVFGSADPKTSTILDAQYNDGENILGLNERHIANVVTKLQQAAVSKITSQILR